jgi:hypothetical protein
VKARLPVANRQMSPATTIPLCIVHQPSPPLSLQVVDGENPLFEKRALVSQTVI